MADDPKYPSDLLDRFQVRLPTGLRERIAAAAKANSRSMNSEIVATLEEKYPAPEGPDLESLYAEMDHLLEAPPSHERAARIREVTDLIEEQLNQKMEELKFLRMKVKSP